MPLMSFTQKLAIKFLSITIIKQVFNDACDLIEKEQIKIKRIEPETGLV